ncbi:MAG: ribonuclease III [Lentisphaeria bacterium]|nr:ribonuclease III [Lentisphaeria bacterium]
MNEERVPQLLRKLGMPREMLPLLQEALTHRTYAVERGLKYDNQRLEFLGDAVLEIIHTEYLYHRYPDLAEGDMTKIRAALSCEKTLAAAARKLDLGRYLLIGNGEKECSGNERESTLCDLFEAVLGAVYLASGLEGARRFVHGTMAADYPDPRRLLCSLNPKGQLQELVQGRWKRVPEYRLFRRGGPPHQPFFEVEVRVGPFVAPGRGSSRKLAETAAAVKMEAFLHRRWENELS